MKIEGRAIDRSFYSITGLYVFPKGVSNFAKIIEKSERGRLEMVSLNQTYLVENKLQVQVLGEGFKWLDTNSFDSLMKASRYIHKQKDKQVK
jgi:glucose-1-phosphate thymidylyltransferase